MHLSFPLRPRYQGNVISVEVKNNDQVTAGQVLIRIDPTDYEIAVATAEAALQVTQQSIDAGVAGVEAAEANVEAARASMWRSEQDAVRMRRIRDEDPGAISQRRLTRQKPALPPPNRGLLLSLPTLNLLATRWVKLMRTMPTYCVRKRPWTRPMWILIERF